MNTQIIDHDSWQHDCDIEGCLGHISFSQSGYTSDDSSFDDSSFEEYLTINI